MGSLTKLGYPSYHARLYKKPYLILALVFTIVSLALLAGVSGPFLFDDFHNLEPIGLDGGIHNFELLTKYVLGGKDGIWRSVPKFTFVINSTVWPADAFWFKLTNIGIHIFNGVLVYLLIKILLLVKRMDTNVVHWVPILVAIFWVASASCVSTVLYVVQRIAQLSAMFSLLSLISMTYMLNADTRKKIFLAGSLALISFVAAVISKRNAAILPLAMVLVIHVFYAGMVKSNWQKLFLVVLYFIGAAVVIAFIYTVFKSADGFSFRGYSMLERLGVQGYVLVKYVQYWLMPWVEGQSLFHDDLEWYLQNALPARYYYFWLVHLVVLISVIAVRRRSPLILFGCAWFYLWHLIESTVLPLEVMFEHRNYIPSVGLSVVASVCIYNIWNYGKTVNWQALGFAVFLLFFGIQMIFLTKRSAIWANEFMLLSKWAYEKPDSIRAQTSYVSTLSRAGMAEHASTKAEEIYDKFGVFTGLMNVAWRSCLSGFEPMTEIELTPEKVTAANYVPGILFYLQRFFELENKDCLKKLFPNNDVIVFAEAVGEMEQLKYRKAYFASYLNLMADEYIARRDYSNAVRSRELLYKTQPSSDTALLTARLFLTGGNLTLAEQYLKYAEQHIEKSWWVSGRNDKRYEELRNILEALKNKDI